MAGSTGWRTAALGSLALLIAAACDPSGPGTLDAADGTDGRDGTSDVRADARPDAAGDIGDSTDGDGCGSDAYRASTGRCRPAPRSTADSDCPSGRYTGGDLFAGDGVCLPARPRDGAACPSGDHFASEAFVGDGVCRPRSPNLEDWTCDGNWRLTPAFAGGDATPPEGLESLQICTPPDRPDTCDEGTLAPAGASSCRRQGTDCPATGSQWIAESEIANLTPDFEGTIHYVSARPGESGTGSRQSPYRSIGTAVDAAAPGDVVALGRGTWDQPVATSKRLAIVGACVTETTIDLPVSADSSPVVDLSDTSGATLANLTLSGPDTGVLVDNPGGDIRLADLVITDAGRHGVNVVDGPSTVQLERLLVDESEKAGLKVQNDAKVRVRESVFDRNRNAGIFTEGNERVRPELDIVDSVVRRTRTKADDTEGYGIHARYGAGLALERSIVADNRRAGLLVYGKRTTVEIAQSAVVGTTPNPASSRAVGVDIAEQVFATIDRLVVDGSTTSGLVLEQSVRAPSVEHLLVRGADSPTGSGAGIEVASGARTQLEQTLVAGHPRTGVAVRGYSTNIHFTNSVVWRTPAHDGTARSLSARDGATLNVRRSLLAGTDRRGLHAAGADTTVLVRDLAIRAPDGSPRRGAGLMATGGASVTGSRIDVAGPRQLAVAVRDGADSTVELEQTRLADASTGAYIDADATLALSAALVDGNHSAGVVARGANSAVELRDTGIVDTGSDSSDPGLGVGLALYDGANATLRRTALRANRATALETRHQQSRLEGRDVSIDKRMLDTSAGTGTRYGLAIAADPAEATFERLHVAGALGTGLFVRDARGIEFRDLVVERTATNPEGVGDGMYFFSNAEVALTRTLSTDHRRHGLVLSGSSAEVTDAAAARNRGTAVVRQRGAEWQPTRVRLHANENDRDRCREQCYRTPTLPDPLDIELPGR